MYDKRIIISWLERYRTADREAEALYQRYILYNDRIHSVQAVQYHQQPGGRPKGSNIEDSTGIKVERLIELETAYKEKQTQANALYHEIDRTIKQITGKGSADMKAVLQMRYLDFCKWPEVNEMIFGRNPDFIDREESYLRRVNLIHNKALQCLAPFIPDNERGENKDDKEDI